MLTEFPICRSSTQAQALLDLAAAKDRVLHIEHIELLGGVAVVLAQADLRPESGLLSFQGGPREGSVAWGNVARIHRAVHALGEPSGVRVECRTPERLSGALIYPWGELGLDLRQQEGLSRSTRMVLSGPQVWVHQDRTLHCDGQPVPLPEIRGLFLEDQLRASARILDGAAPYVSDARILKVLQLVEALEGAPLSPAE